MRTPRRSAFTLLEVLLVVALLGVLTAIAWPTFSGALESEQLTESATRCRALFAMCRAEAMNEARRYRITVREDGSLKVARQLDAIYAPHVYVKVREPWARTPPLLERVWVEAVLPLPDGPPPFEVEDDLIAFEDFLEQEPIPVGELELDFDVDFEPDGLSDSAQWVLRDERGRGIKLTLDGRLGRVTIEEVESLADEEVQRPEALEPDEDDQISEAELLAEYLPG